MRIVYVMSDTHGVCGCRGARSCRLCEGRTGTLSRSDDTASSLYQCHNCGRAGSIGDCPVDASLAPLHACREQCSAVAVLHSFSITSHHPDTPLDGVTVVKEFVSPEDELAILAAIDGQTWTNSQSGRRKQDYGPKVNFKRRKLKLGTFSGLPHYIEPHVRKMREQVDILTDFVPVELCNLDYHPERGAHIEAHRDDSWLWGERLVTLNLLSPVLLAFSHTPPITPHSSATPSSTTFHVLIPLPPRSLVVVCGPARHLWLHSILREHVISRRVGITLRELSNEFRGGGECEEVGRHILDIAQQFNGHPTSLSCD